MLFKFLSMQVQTLSLEQCRYVMNSNEINKHSLKKAKEIFKNGKVYTFEVGTFKGLACFLLHNFYVKHRM